MRKNNVKEINLQIETMEPFSYRNCSGFTISWSSTVGWGEYNIYTKDGINWSADSETMDCNEDKEFITELMRLFIEKLQILS